jgi:hypothetical protein
MRSHLQAGQFGLLRIFAAPGTNEKRRPDGLFTVSS